MKEKTMVKEKKLDLKGFWKNLVSAEPIELTQEEIILNDPTISKENKQIIIHALDENKTLAKVIFGDNLKSIRHVKLTRNGQGANLKKIDEQILQNSKKTTIDKDERGE